MNKKIISILCVFLSSAYSSAQSIAPQSINSGGTTLSQTNGSLSFTVGELVVLTQTDSEGNTLGGGFTTGSTITTASIKPIDVALMNVKVYPNPTTDLVNIQIQDATISEVILEVVDIQGKQVFTGKYATLGNLIGINAAHYSTGTYFLNLKNAENVILGTYKIIKH